MTRRAGLYALGLAVLGCGPYRAPPPDPNLAPPLAGTAPPADAAAAGSEGKLPPPDGPLVVEPAPAPPPLERMPRVSFVSPKPNEAITPEKAEAFEVRLDVRDWFLAPGDHVHLVLDNRPYKALEDGRTSIRLGDVFPAEPLAEGQHAMFAFPARADHVGVKPHEQPSAAGAKREGSPLAAVTFWVGKAGKPTYKVGDPTLVFSRPKGTYNGRETESLLLDFYLSNASLGEGRGSVVAIVTPHEGAPLTTRLTTWAPMHIKNLPSGIAKVLLELRDKDDQLVPGPYARVEREVSINREANR
jgi:hypothetical protein